MPNELGTPQRPLRVAIVGSGPSGFYSTEGLLTSGINVIVNLFDRLPTPYGLVRYGVAPDHPKIKNVVKVYEKIAENKNFHFFGNVEIGKDLTVHQLRKFHDAVIFATGAETDRKLGILGEDLIGNYTATEFVAWYNGHPDYRNRIFDLSQDVAVIIGQGNVALDVARILCKTVNELKNTDIAQHALDALAKSRIKEVHVIGRRGPAQAAFSPIEIREFSELEDCNIIISQKDLELNYASQCELEEKHNAQKKKNFGILKELVEKSFEKKNRKCQFHFLKSPAAIYGDESGKLNRIYLERNELIGDPGQQKAKGTGEKEELRCGIIFRSIGYRGVPIKGLPFHEQSGVIPNTAGRIADSEAVFPGLYTVGWIKRGPSGIIGTNKPDADETVKHLIEDVKSLNPCKNPDNGLLINLLKDLHIRYVTFDDWKKIDQEEITRGQKTGKPREKFVSVQEMLDVINGNSAKENGMKKILLIDDEPDIIEQVKNTIDSKNAEVFEALNGEEGLKKAKKIKPDLVIVDVMMPELSGYQVCQSIKTDDQLKHTKVIILTKRDQPIDIEMVGACRADSYMTKPFDPAVLKKAIQELLK